MLDQSSPSATKGPTSNVSSIAPPPSLGVQAETNQITAHDPPPPPQYTALVPDVTSLSIGRATSTNLTSSEPIPTPTVPVSTSTSGQPAQIPAQTSTNAEQKQESQSQQVSPQKAVVTKVKLSEELNIFDWFRSTDIINQIAEKAKNSVDSVITVLDPGMKEYLYSGGNINIIVISDSERLVSPIRDAFQTVFGRATVVAARYNPPEKAADYPVKLACGFEEAITVAQERIKLLRHDTSSVPQNQVVVVIQPTLVSVVKNDTSVTRVNQGLNVAENSLPEWFLTYSMIIEDPVLGSTINSYSQFIPIDSEVITTAKEAKFPDGFPGSNLGFAKSISELMILKLNLQPNDSEDLEGDWINVWSGLNEIKLVHDLSISLAHLYRRKWNSCVG